MTIGEAAANMQQRVGVIDLGSNTTQLIMMAYQPHYAFKLTDEIKETVRRVEGASADNVLHEAPVKRAVKAIQMFSALRTENQEPRTGNKTRD